jgi:type IV fimbrial biogenesis protein FimT
MLQDVMKDKRQHGFTLIELMFTIVVLAVLLGIGVPNFRDFIRNGRLTSAANGLLGDLNFARTEAIKQRSRVVVCAVDASAPDTCLTTGSVFSAWTIFTDADGNSAIDTPATDVLRRHPRVGDGVVGTPSGALNLVYGASGFVLPGSATQVIFCDARKHLPTTGNIPAARAVVVSAVGRAGVTRPATGCP